MRKFFFCIFKSTGKSAVCTLYLIVDINIYMKGDPSYVETFKLFDF